jgi:hypothetical protein
VNSVIKSETKTRVAYGDLNIGDTRATGCRTQELSLSLPAFMRKEWINDWRIQGEGTVTALGRYIEGTNL